MRTAAISVRACRYGSRLPEDRSHALAQSLHGVLLEDKGCAFAMHYRQAPNLEETHPAASRPPGFNRTAGL